MALATVTACMFVVVFMAVVAGGAELDTVKLAGMTGVAMYVGMFARQLEFRIPVVVEDKGFPFVCVMTLSAFFAVASAVNIVNTVAGYTFSSQVFIALIGVATIACGFLMFATQRKFSLVMIEAARLPCLNAMTLVTCLT